MSKRDSWFVLLGDDEDVFDTELPQQNFDPLVTQRVNFGYDEDSDSSNLDEAAITQAFAALVDEVPDSASVVQADTQPSIPTNLDIDNPPIQESGSNPSTSVLRTSVSPKHSLAESSHNNKTDNNGSTCPDTISNISKNDKHENNNYNNNDNNDNNDNNNNSSDNTNTTVSNTNSGIDLEHNSAKDSPINDGSDKHVVTSDKSNESAAPATPRFVSARPRTQPRPVPRQNYLRENNNGQIASSPASPPVPSLNSSESKAENSWKGIPISQSLSPIETNRTLLLTSRRRDQTPPTSTSTTTNSVSSTSGPSSRASDEVIQEPGKFKLSRSAQHVSFHRYGLSRGSSDKNIKSASGVGSSDNATISSSGKNLRKASSLIGSIVWTSSVPLKLAVHGEIEGSTLLPIQSEDDNALTTASSNDNSEDIGNQSSDGSQSTSYNLTTDGIVQEEVSRSDGNQLRVIGGTIRGVVGHITQSQSQGSAVEDSQFIDALLLTYRLFINPKDILDIIFEQYNPPTITTSTRSSSMSSHDKFNYEKQLKLQRYRLANVLKRWLSHHTYELENIEFLHKLHTHVNNTFCLNEVNLGESIHRLIVQAGSQQPETVYIPPAVYPKGDSFEDFDAAEVARQFALCEHKLLRAIHPRELLNQRWEKEPELSPNVIKLVNFSYDVKCWILSYASCRTSEKELHEFLKKILTIFLLSVAHNNYNTAEEIHSALDVIQNNYSNLWAKLEKDKRYTLNYLKAKRMFLDRPCNPALPGLPSIGRYLHELSALEAQYSNTLQVILPLGVSADDPKIAGPVINMVKMKHVATILNDIIKFQQIPFMFEKVEVIYNYISNLHGTGSFSQKNLNTSSTTVSGTSTTDNTPFSPPTTPPESPRSPSSTTPNIEQARGSVSGVSRYKWAKSKSVALIRNLKKKMDQEAQLSEGSSDDEDDVPASQIISEKLAKFTDFVKSPRRSFVTNPGSTPVSTTFPNISTSGNGSLSNTSTNSTTAPSPTRPSVSSNSPPIIISNKSPDNSNKDSIEDDAPQEDDDKPAQVNEHGIVWGRAGIIKGGTLQRLIQEVTYEETDPRVVDVFLLTYRTYISPSELLIRILDRYDVPSSKPFEDMDEDEKQKYNKSVRLIHLRLGNFLKHWLSEYFYDFDAAMLENLQGIIACTFAVNEPSLAKSIQKLISDISQGVTIAGRNTATKLQFSEKPPPPVIPKSNAFEDFDCSEVARQLCLYEQRNFQEISSKELLRQAWSKNKSDAPNIIKVIKKFNDMTFWINSVIVQQPGEKERAKCMKYFIKVALKCREYNNFNTAQEITSALEKPAVFRLKNTWARVEKNKKLWEKYEELKALLSSDFNFKAYRQALKEADPPCLPYIGRCLSDLTFVEDGNPDYLKVEGDRKDILNFEKMRRIATIIQKYLMFHTPPYNFQKVDVIYSFFESELQYLGERECYNLSKEIEPR